MAGLAFFLVALAYLRASGGSPRAFRVLRPGATLSFCIWLDDLGIAGGERLSEARGFALMGESGR